MLISWLSQFRRRIYSRLRRVLSERRFLVGQGHSSTRVAMVTVHGDADHGYEDELDAAAAAADDDDEIKR